MSLGESINKRKHPLEEYVGKWVYISVGDRGYNGVLIDIDDRRGYFTLSPYLSNSYATVKLPRRYRIDEGRKMISYEGTSHSIEEITRESIEMHIEETEREFEHAKKEREQNWKKLEEELKKE